MHWLGLQALAQGPRSFPSHQNALPRLILIHKHVVGWLMPIQLRDCTVQLAACALHPGWHGCWDQSLGMHAPSMGLQAPARHLHVQACVRRWVTLRLGHIVEGDGVTAVLSNSQGNVKELCLVQAVHGVNEPIHGSTIRGARDGCHILGAAFLTLGQKEQTCG